MTAKFSQSPADHTPKHKDDGVAVAIVNYCTAKLTIDCLQSLDRERQDVPKLRVYVADNASPDGSGQSIAQAIIDNGWSDWATVLLNPVNGGFAYGNNQVLRRVQAEAERPAFVWLLNSDTVVRPGALGVLIDYLKANPRVGIAGSRLEWENGERQASAFRFHSITSEFVGAARFGPITRLLGRWRVAPELGDEPTRFDWLAGASMLMPYRLVETVGLMDERYFLYFEETDYCRRVASAGFTCAYVPDSRVIHYVGQSTGVTSGRAKRIPKYWFESRRRYYVTHHGRAYAIAVDLALIAGSGIGYAVDVLLRRKMELPQNFLSDLIKQSALFHGAETTA